MDALEKFIADLSEGSEKTADTNVITEEDMGNMDLAELTKMAQGIMTGGEEGQESQDEVEKDEGQEGEFSPELQEKLAEADLVGRVMAHGYANEMFSMADNAEDEELRQGLIEAIQEKVASVKQAQEELEVDDGEGLKTAAVNVLEKLRG